jgi:hypothetical protein
VKKHKHALPGENFDAGRQDDVSTRALKTIFEHWSISDTVSAVNACDFKRMHAALPNWYKTWNSKGVWWCSKIPGQERQSSEALVAADVHRIGCSKTNKSMGHTLQKLEMLNKYHGVIRCWFVLECPLRALGASICDRLLFVSAKQIEWDGKKEKTKLKSKWG